MKDDMMRPGFLIPTEFLERVKARARSQGRTVTDVILSLLSNYVQDDPDVLSRRIRTLEGAIEQLKYEIKKLKKQ